MVDVISCLLLFKFLFGPFFLFTSFVFHFNFKIVVVSAAPFDGTVDNIVVSLHLVVDPVVSHFISVVVSLGFALKI